MDCNYQEITSQRLTVCLPVAHPGRENAPFGWKMTDGAVLQRRRRGTGAVCLHSTSYSVALICGWRSWLDKRKLFCLAREIKAFQRLRKLDKTHQGSRHARARRTRKGET